MVGTARSLALLVAAFALIGCDRFQSARTPAPTATAVPTAISVPTEEPTSTAVPSSPTSEPTEVATLVSEALPTGTETATVTVSPTATRTRLPFTPKPRATPTETAIALKYEAPVLLEPKGGATFTESRSDLLFKWKPVADLGPHECYFLTLQVINLADQLQRYSEDSFLAQDTCNSALSSGVQEFTLRKKNPPSYAGLVAEAIKRGGTPSNKFGARWWVTVVLDNGPDSKNPGRDLTSPLGPASQPAEFTLVSP